MKEKEIEEWKTDLNAANFLVSVMKYIEFSVKDLRTELKRRNLSVNGLKSDLVGKI